MTDFRFAARISFRFLFLCLPARNSKGLLSQGSRI